MASRLSFLLWNSIPDKELLDAAENGDLDTQQGIEDQIERMISDNKIISGINHMFIDFFELYKLDDLIKDPLVFNHAHPDFGYSAKEEILYGLYYLILVDDDDFRNLMTTQKTTIDLRLAALYDIPAPQIDGFGQVWLQPSGGRRGLLGQAGILAMHSHAASSSATLRGMFVRKRLLCQNILPAPADVDASLPEADSSSPTLRERIATHLENDSCSGCHEPLDSIGLGLENFDGIGRWRDKENETTIDPSGSLDGEGYSNAWELGELISNHPDFGSCFAKHLFTYAIGQSMSEDMSPYHDWLSHSFAYNDWSFLNLIRTVTKSNAFRHLGAPE